MPISDVATIEIRLIVAVAVNGVVYQPGETAELEHRAAMDLIAAGEAERLIEAEKELGMKRSPEVEYGAEE